MDTRKNRVKNAIKIDFKTGGLVHKAVAGFVTVFFIFSGIPVPTSFAGKAPVTLNENQKLVPTVTLDQVNARPAPATKPVPSGVEVRKFSPLSANVSETADEPAVPSGWTRASSNENYAFRTTQVGNYVAVLSLMDLRSGQTTRVRKINIGGSYPEDFDSYDVLSDGSAVIVGITRSPYGSVTYLQKPDGSASLSLNGRVTALEYDAAARVLRLDLKNTVTNNPSWDTKTVFVDVGTMTTMDAPVPAGWTRASSNENYAFQQSGGTSRTLSLMDLRTGQVQVLVTVDLAMTHPDHISQVYDVSEDGTTVIFGVTRAWSSIGGETYVQRITDASSRLTLAGNLESIEMDGMIAILMVKGIEQRIDLATLLLLPPVLSWNPAASNADYQVAVEQQLDGTKTLHIRNFSTGVETVIAGINGAMDFYDVSPDGTTVLYGQRASKDPAVVGFTVLYSLTTPDRQVTLMSGGMMTYSFTDYGEIALKTFSFPVEVYQLGTLERYDFNIVTETVNSPGNVYQLKDERSVGMFKFVKLGTPGGVSSFDLSSEESPVTDYLLTDHGLYYIAGHNNPAEIKYLDLDAAYQTGNFDPVSLTVQNGVEANDPAQINYASLAVADPASVTIPGPLGSRESMKFVSAGELLKITDASGGVRFIQLNTGLEVAPPVPAGWTRTALNPNYATQVQVKGKNRILVVKNLLTGQDTAIAEIKLSLDFSGQCTIAPDGRSIVYTVAGPRGRTGTTIVQRLDNLKEKVSLPGVTSSVRFIQGRWELTINKSIWIVDLTTGKISKRRA
ncbi:MAG: hypothetical protein BWY42_01096 [Candidatus Omnitrophica bacterium ADurb.Bin277]|nr:MAG: hypothetical protein BWY42_01096 [Candidatus Omnitrophica bacterium ADurb.Bin277]